ncbi:MAG: 50S ribosomal protein L4 [Chlorobi bacterium]|nr:MAG: 50S ribosomal protein L4 [Bacteroidota bacterium]KXK36072.1 MAG: 50S ribosomal protein L4 [Chlorobi bacterium OLB6]MBE2266415.1 50S ribosomal protein L4 [Flavobacteriales bacterium]MBL1160335.1 50S ribosomal protein L4 [Chlorobiota bacterium]MBW7854380.1 50S ribosomal protein L4 [Candidatus Kapabacteria bacterium]MCC6331722.1 50S ribosomal protein L4 [Ignavibacteria bacterium]
MKVDVHTKDGAKSGTVELPDSVFNVEPSEHAMHLAIRAYLTNRRQGTHKTKTRSEVRGGGKKPFKQKGTGGARRGSSRSPLLPGGGTIHGPFPHPYHLDLPTKVKRLARKSALTLRARENNVVVVEDFSVDTPKTKQIASVLKNLNIDGKKILMLLPATDRQLVLSGRNIKGLSSFPADKISAYDVLNHSTLLIFKSAVPVLAKSFGDDQQADNSGDEA